MSRRLDPADEELLQAALASSFTSLPPRATEPEASSALPSKAPSIQPTPEQPATSSTVEASANVEDSYKDEYDRQLAAWRAEAEIARAKAERTRAEWEIRRKAEEEERQRVATEEATRKEQRESTLAGWETVSPTDDSRPMLGASVSGRVGTSDKQASAQEAARLHTQIFGVDAQMPGPSPADAQNLVSGERPRSGESSGLSFPKPSPPTTQADRNAPPGLDSETYTSEEDEPRSSRNWEEVPSLASSFPSLPDNIISSPSSQNDKAYPKATPRSVPGDSTHHKHGEQSAKHRGENEHHHSHSHHHEHHGGATVASNRGPPPSVTLSIFTPGLSPRARVLAVASSIAINFVLPFINGVMLGFGEIFAKNFVAPLFGIRPPSVANVGVRTPMMRDRRR